MSDDRIDITEAELIAAILDASNGGVDLRRGATTAEIAAAKGISIMHAKRLIANEKAAGRLECIKVKRETLDEKLTMVSGWRLVQQS